MTPEYMALRQRIMQQWGLGEGAQQLGGPAMSGTTQSDRFQQMAGRGTAPATAGNILGAGMNAMNLMGGMGAVLTGATSIGELGAGAAPGSWGGINLMQGYRTIPPEKRRLIGNLVDYHEALQDPGLHGGANAGEGPGRSQAGDIGGERGHGGRKAM